MNKNIKAENLKIAYIGGGSTNWARIFMNDMAREKSMKGDVYLFDIDYERANYNEIIGNKISEMPEALGKWRYLAVKTLGEALKDADFVFISILPGEFNHMYSDVHEPEKYGIYQSVGDTVGLGGVIRSWRTVPMMDEIAKGVEQYCPDAWVINFTNPMSICIKALYEAFPKIKAYGCCHEVFGTQKLMLEALKEFEGVENANVNEIKTNVIGINHFTWITKASYKGTDLMPIYSKFVDKYYETGFSKEKDNWMNNHFKSAEKVKFDLFRRYGSAAAAGDRHLAEFVPNNWYLTNNEKWKFKLTPVSWRIENQKKQKEMTIKMVNGEEKIELFESGEDFVRQIKGLLGIEDVVTNVNLPNNGQISNIPLGTIVETNAYFTFNTVSPVLAGPVPEEIRGLMVPHVENQAVIVRASLERNSNALFKCFTVDPQASKLSLEEAENLFNIMLQKGSILG